MGGAVGEEEDDEDGARRDRSKSSKEDEDDHDDANSLTMLLTMTLKTPPDSFAIHPLIDPAVQGGGDDPNRCVVTQIGCSDWALATRCLAPMAGSGPIGTFGERSRSCGIVSLRIP